MIIIFFAIFVNFRVFSLKVDFGLRKSSVLKLRRLPRVEGSGGGPDGGPEAPPVSTRVVETTVTVPLENDCCGIYAGKTFYFIEDEISTSRTSVASLDCLCRLRVKNIK